MPSRATPSRANPVTPPRTSTGRASGASPVASPRKFDFKTKDYIYAIGSKYPDQTSQKCEVYDISKDKWHEIADMT